MGEEKKFELKIRKWFEDQGAWVLKTWSNGTQRVGVPDLLICYKGRFIGIEVKASRGKPSDLQIWNIQNIEKAGGIGVILYPKDWDEFKERMVKL